jgi:hypothetical protein
MDASDSFSTAMDLDLSELAALSTQEILGVFCSTKRVFLNTWRSSLFVC